MSEPQNGALQQRLFIALQYLLPQHGLSRLVRWATRIERPRFKNALIRWFMSAFRPDLSEAQNPDPFGYPSFNAFFTRPLRHGTRPVAPGPGDIASPVDGTVSECGAIAGNQLIQAKGLGYSVASLLGGRSSWAAEFDGGQFATIYLAPYNYHRIHMAVDATLREAWFVPGQLFSVNQTTARHVPNLFARNERIVCCFESDHGRHVLVMVGALNVGSMDTVWHGEVAPRQPRVVTLLDAAPLQAPLTLPRGAEMGRFNMGSTVILLFPRDRAAWSPALRAGRIVRMGERIGRLSPPAP